MQQFSEGENPQIMAATQVVCDPQLIFYAETLE